jgi:hypothetical protein
LLLIFFFLLEIRISDKNGNEFIELSKLKENKNLKNLYDFAVLRITEKYGTSIEPDLDTLKKIKETINDLYEINPSLTSKIDLLLTENILKIRKNIGERLNLVDNIGKLFGYNREELSDFLYNNHEFLDQVFGEKKHFPNSKDIKFYKQNVDNEKYNSIAKKEINDLKNSIKIECVFSGSLFIEYPFKNLTTNKLDQNSGEYPSIYSFLMDFERQLRGKKNLKEFEIKLTLNKL